MAAAALRTWVGNGVVHLGDARRDDRIRAGRRAAQMTARLERGEERRAASPLTRLPEGDDFGMAAGRWLRYALPDDLSVRNYDGTYDWVR